MQSLLLQYLNFLLTKLERKIRAKEDLNHLYLTDLKIFTLLNYSKLTDQTRNLAVLLDANFVTLECLK